MRSTDRAQRREPEPEPTAQPNPAEAVLALQRAYGNHAVGRVLARKNESPAGSGPDYKFGPGGVEQTALQSDKDVDDAVEAVVEDYFDGYRAMFMRNSVATTPDDWCDVVFSRMEPFYKGDEKKPYAFGRPQVLAAVKRLKTKYRRETLLHMTRTLVYQGGEPLPGYEDELTELKVVLVRQGAYLDDDDEDALQAIVDTKAAFAATKVETAGKDKILSDAENIVVVMDAHQNKHQMDLIAEFGTYTGEPGNKFASGKDLEWHRQNTLPVVRQTIRNAVSRGQVSPTHPFSPSKDAINGINYDLQISYDEPTGKYVGTYHCNPRVKEV